ncbi:T/G mismatch-specific endonuclease [Streptomyces sp. 2131.1]|nr:T/G mismatch-specific endonuclease [Streptomyces sp. 2131.1]
MPLLDQVLDRVLRSPQHDAAVTVTEGDELGARWDAGFRQQPERQLDTAVVVDADFDWFPGNGQSVAPSEAGPVDGLTKVMIMDVGRGAGRRWVSTAAGEHLHGRRARNTRPEILLRKAVHRTGLRFRLQQRVAPRCTADFVLPRHHVAVFVDGCFWHDCPEHGPEGFRGPNASLWRDKINANKDRDRRNTEQATAAGWTVVRVWECEIRRDAEAAARRVAEATGRGTAAPRQTSTTSVRRPASEGRPDGPSGRGSTRGTGSRSRRVRPPGTDRNR